MATRKVVKQNSGAVTDNREAPPSAGFWQSLGMVLRQITVRQWVIFTAVVLIFVVATFGFTVLARVLLRYFPLSTETSQAILYASVFVIFLFANLSLIIPIPITTPVIAAAVIAGNPLIVGLAAAAGGSIGEIGGYLVGRLGHNVLMRDNFMCRINQRFCASSLKQDVERYGPIGIGVLAAQPIIPFDIGGIVAGSIKMSFGRFYIALLIGRTVKYVMFAYLVFFLGHIPFIGT
jgi:membrane protein YqaA with SNARE-associated domain